MKPAIAPSRCRLAAAIALTLAATAAHAGATITVNSSDDNAASPFCNLRNAIASAANGASTPNCVGQVSGTFGDPDTIQFDASLANSTIALSQGELLISGVAIDLVGSGQTIDAGGLSRIFDVDNTSTLSASNMTLTGGHSASVAGGIYVHNNSALTLTNTTVTQSTATTNGGGVYAKQATLTLNSATISGNTATGSGGAIYATYATVALSGSTVSGNSAGARGGGVYATNSTVALANTVVTSNTATTQGGGIYVSAGLLTVSSSTISNNTATDKGGGVTSANYNVLSMDHSIVSGNTGVRGGGIYPTFHSTTTVRSSTISGNTANCATETFCAGGIYAYTSNLDVIDSTITGNVAQGHHNYFAGGVYVFNTYATFVNSTITGNSAIGNSFLAGGLWEMHGASDSGGLTLINSTVAGNSVTSYNAGAYLGGGVEAGLNGSDPNFTGTLTLANTIVSSNLPAGSDVAIGASTSLSTAYSLLGSAQNVSAFNDPGNHNIFSDTPNLGPLQNNGGATQTMALLTDSPAIGTGSIALAVYSGSPLNYDQRGMNDVRTFSGTIDIGAFEYQGDRVFANGMEAAP